MPPLRARTGEVEALDPPRGLLLGADDDDASYPVAAPGCDAVTSYHASPDDDTCTLAVRVLP